MEIVLPSSIVAALITMTVVGIVGVCIFLLVKSLFDNEGFFDGYIDIGIMPKPFIQTGRLPMSTKVKGELVRFHNPDYFWAKDEFWKTFQDGPWKWGEQQRFAGKDFNCGHYFALNKVGALAESKFYELDLTQYTMLTIKANIDCVLDLTYEDHILELGREALVNFDHIPYRSRLMTLLAYMLERSKGGNDFTDCAGRWAQRRGYAGILFFGARALERYPDLIHRIHHGQDEYMGIPTVHGHFNDMRSKPDLKNLVIFSGAMLTTQISRYQLSSNNQSRNSLFKMDLAKLDSELEFNAEYQAKRYRYAPIKVFEPD